jgi:hypothetical protein
VRDWSTPAAQDRVVNAVAGERHELVNLIWSAKESALKVPQRLRRDTRSVEVDVVDAADERWARIVVRPGCRRLSRRSRQG